MTKLFWIDLEMTGLDVEKEVIIEVGAVVTDLKFKVLDTYHAVVKQPQKYLDAMDDWNTKHHRESGLTALVPTGKAPDRVEDDLIELLDIHFTDERPVLAGNSIGQDRLFIDKYFKRFSKQLHYRMLDVTSWKLIFNNLYGLQSEKTGKHRAIDDIKESIEELKFYLSHIKAEPKI
jgi:oligoribonuclease